MPHKIETQPAISNKVDPKLPRMYQDLAAEKIMQVTTPHKFPAWELKTIIKQSKNGPFVTVDMTDRTGQTVAGISVGGLAELRYLHEGIEALIREYDKSAAYADEFGDIGEHRNDPIN